MECTKSDTHRLEPRPMPECFAGSTRNRLPRPQNSRSVSDIRDCYCRQYNVECEAHRCWLQDRPSTTKRTLMDRCARECSCVRALSGFCIPAAICEQPVPDAYYAVNAYCTTKPTPHVSRTPRARLLTRSAGGAAPIHIVWRRPYMDERPGIAMSPQVQSIMRVLP